MNRQLQFSVSCHQVQRARGGKDRQYAAYLDAIADVGATVELFAPNPHSPALAQAQTVLNEHGLEIGTIHGPHLQRLLDDRNPGGYLRACVRAEHLASTIDRVPDQAITPSVSTHHLPRLWPDDERTVEEARETFLSTYSTALPTLEPDPDYGDLSDAYDGELITATVAFENVAEKTNYQYILVTPDDVRSLRQTAKKLDVANKLAFTCDVGHAANPYEMLTTMDPLVNVHLHSTIDTTTSEADRLCSRFNLENMQELGEFDRPNIAHHLPPYVGTLDLPAIFDTLDARGYDGPITVELYDNYQRAPFVYKTADTLSPHC